MQTDRPLPNSGHSRALSHTSFYKVSCNHKMTHPERTPRETAESDVRQSRAKAALMRVLKTAPQDLWLDTIRRTKPGIHDDLVFWMLSQVECDFAVAIHAFYRSDPAYHLDNPHPLPSKPGEADLFALTLLNWDKGYYRTHKLRVQDQDVDARTLARINQKAMARPRGSLPFGLPGRFLNPAGGDPVHLPPYLSPDNAVHLWPIYADLGLHVPHAAPGLPRRVAKAKGMLSKVRFRTRRT